MSKSAPSTFLRDMVRALFSVVTAGTFSGNFFSTFGEDDSGELYLGDNNNGTLYKIVWSPTGVNDINPSANVSYFVKENAINISIHNLYIHKKYYYRYLW